MNEMIERAARAVFEITLAARWAHHVPSPEDIARAVVIELREPTEAMIDAAELLDDICGDRASARTHWQAMIDEVLK
jgi:hypothetical protein